MISAPNSDATASFAAAGPMGSGRRPHCCPTATAAAAPTIISATHTGPNGGVGTAASTGTAGT